MSANHDPVPLVRRRTGVMLMATAALLVMSLVWLGDAVLAASGGTEPADFRCMSLPEAPGEGYRIRAEASWWPPGLHCEAYYGEVAGWRSFAEPSWFDTAISGTLWIAAAVVAATASVRLALTALPLLGGRRTVTALCLLLTAHTFAALAIPVTVTQVGGVVLYWLPVIAVVATGWYIAAGWALRPALAPKQRATVEPG